MWYHPLFNGGIRAFPLIISNCDLINAILTTKNSVHINGHFEFPEIPFNDMFQEVHLILKTVHLTKFCN